MFRMLDCSPLVQETDVQSQVETQEMVLDAFLPYIQNYQV